MPSRAATRKARSVFAFDAARRRVWSVDAQSGRMPRRCLSASILRRTHGGAFRVFILISASCLPWSRQADARSTTSLVMPAGFEPLLSVPCEKLCQLIPFAIITLKAS